MWAPGGAARLAQADEEGVPLFPILCGKVLAQGHLGVIRGFRDEQPEAVCDAVDVDIDADGLFVEGNGDDEVGCFASDSGELAELFDGLWDGTVELGVEHVRDLFDVPCFLAEEADRKTEVFEALGVDLPQGIEIWDFGEEFGDNLGCGLVLGACAENRGDEDAERIACVDRDEVDDGGAVGVELMLEKRVDGGKVFERHAGFPLRLLSGEEALGRI